MREITGGWRTTWAWCLCRRIIHMRSRFWTAGWPPGRALPSHASGGRGALGWHTRRAHRDRVRGATAAASLWCSLPPPAFLPSSSWELGCSPLLRSVGSWPSIALPNWLELRVAKTKKNQDVRPSHHPSAWHGMGRRGEPGGEAGRPGGREREGQRESDTDGTATTTATARAAAQAY